MDLDHVTISGVGTINVCIGYAQVHMYNLKIVYTIEAEHNTYANPSTSHQICSLGSAVVVEPIRGASVFAMSLFNPLCFLRYYMNNMPPEYWKGVNAHTSNVKLFITCDI